MCTNTRTNTRTRYFTKSEAIARRVRRKAPGQAFSALLAFSEKRPRLKSRVKRAAGLRAVPTQAKELQCGGHKTERATQSGPSALGDQKTECRPRRSVPSTMNEYQHVHGYVAPHGQSIDRKVMITSGVIGEAIGPMVSCLRVCVNTAAPAFGKGK